MRTAARRLLAAAALAALAGPRPGVSAQDQSGGLRFETACAFPEPYTVDGYVTNRDAAEYVAVGEVKFVFTPASDISRAEIVFPANSVIPAGQKVRVARARLAFQPQAGGSCRFDVGAALRRAP